MSEQSSRPSQPPQPSQPTPKQPQQPQQPRRAWRDLAEERIAEARARGDFDNLPGMGRPLRLDENVYAGQKAQAYHLLRSNDAAPPEIERGLEIDRLLAQAEAELAALRHRRDTLLARGRRAFASERRTYNVARDNTARRYAEQLRAINSNILSLNIIAPPALGRPLIAVERRLATFEDEFPRVAE